LCNQSMNAESSPKVFCNFTTGGSDLESTTYHLWLPGLKSPKVAANTVPTARNGA
jgi:hypothetical protein